MTTALETAKYFIELASREDEAEPMTHMRVQKLLYYAQGWHLGIFGRPLFTDSLEAWKNGPVVANVYDRVKPVVADQPARALVPTDLGESQLSGRDKVFVETVWRKYLKYSASGLRDLSHSEPPWINARGNVPEGGHCETVITSDDLREFFGSLPEASLPNRSDLETVYQAEAAAREAPAVSFAELKKRRRERS